MNLKEFFQKVSHFNGAAWKNGLKHSSIATKRNVTNIISNKFTYIKHKKAYSILSFPGIGISFKLWVLITVWKVSKYQLSTYPSLQIWSLFWSVFSRIRTLFVSLRIQFKGTKIRTTKKLRIWTVFVSLSIQSKCRKKRTRKISVLGHFSRSGCLIVCNMEWMVFHLINIE